MRSLSTVIVALKRRNCTTLVQTAQNSLLGIRLIKVHFVVVRAIFGTRSKVKETTMHNHHKPTADTVFWTFEGLLGLPSSI